MTFVWQVRDLRRAGFFACIPYKLVNPLATVWISR